MVLLKNIRRGEDYIEADYYVEEDPGCGHIRVRLSDGKRIQLIYAPGNEYSTAPAHAHKRLLELAEMDPLPEESTVYWY